MIWPIYSDSRGIVDIKDDKIDTQVKVNGQRLKKYFTGDWIGHISTFALADKWNKWCQGKEWKLAPDGRQPMYLKKIGEGICV